MRQSLRKQEGHNLLKEYSPWLESFQSSDYSHSIEVPGNNCINTCAHKVCTVVFLIHSYTNYLLTSCDIIHTL